MTKQTWKTICHLDDLVENSGVCALLEGENDTQIAIFNLPQSEQKVFAVENFDPIGKANVLYRGIVGCNDSEPVVASPLYKQQFSLKSGQCLQEEASITAYETRIEQSQVQILV